MLISHADKRLYDNMAFVKVAKASAVPAGVVMGFDADGKSIAVTKVDGRFYAFEDYCPHVGARLSRGLLMGNLVICPLHGSQFDVTTGQKVYGPAHRPVVTYPVKVEGEDILVDL